MGSGVKAKKGGPGRGKKGPREAEVIEEPKKKPVPKKKKSTLSDRVFLKFRVLFRFIRCLSEETKNQLTPDFLELLLSPDNTTHQYLQIEEKDLPVIPDDTITFENARLSEAFVFKVNKQHYPEYYHIIKNPIDLNTIRKSILKRHYLTIREYYDDMLLLFANAMVYNEPGSSIYEAAETMKENFLRIFNLMLKQEMDLEESKDPETGNPNPTVEGNGIPAHTVTDGLPLQNSSSHQLTDVN